MSKKEITKDSATETASAVETIVMYTPENIIEALENGNIGPWSQYGLASEALQHYFPEEYDEDGYCEIIKEVELLEKLGCIYWSDAIIKYQNEIGYDAPSGFNPKCVNKF